MTWWVILLGAFGLLLSLFASGLPIFVCFLLANLLGVLLFMGTAGLGLFANSILDTATTEALVAIPLYVLLGELLFRTGGVTTLYRALNRLIGAIPGRLYVVATMLAAFLGAISGSAMASVAMLGRFVYPTMIERGCNRRLSVGTILGWRHARPDHSSKRACDHPCDAGERLDRKPAGGRDRSRDISRGPVRPLCRGANHHRSLARRQGRYPRSVAARLGPLLLSILEILPLCVIIFLVLGLIILGIAQPTEAAAAGIVGTGADGGGDEADHAPHDLRSLLCAAITTASILIILACAKLFSQLLAFTGATAGLIALMSDVELNRWVLFFLMMATVFLFCKFMDQLAIMLIAVPVYSPIIVHLGFDPIWFWMLFLINITVGGITPPFGYTMLCSSRRRRRFR